jgi:hypothetical protein
VVLTDGPLRTLPARRVPLGAAGTRRVLLLALGLNADGLVVARALGNALLVVDPLDGSGSALPVRPLRRLLRCRAERALRVGDAVDSAVLADRRSSLPPRPPAPGAVGHGAEGVTQVRRPVLLDRLVRQAAGAALPRQRPHHLLVGADQAGMLLEPAGAALLVGAQLLLAVGLLGGDRLGAHWSARPLLVSPKAAKHGGGLAGARGGKLGLGLPAPLSGAVQLPGTVPGGFGEPAAEPVPLGPQLGGGQSPRVGSAGGVDCQVLATVLA